MWSSESDEASCPYCRGEIPDVAERVSDRMKLYVDRAYASSKGSAEEQKKYALAEIDSLNELLDASDNQALHILVLHSRASLMRLTDQPEETMKITKEVLSWSKIPNNVALWQADAYLEWGKLNDAKQAYTSFLEHKQWGKYPKSILSWICAKSYEMHDYDTVIKRGNDCRSVT